MYNNVAKPTMYFIGVTTSSSSIMKVFPEWAKFLDLGDVEIKGIDLKIHDKPIKYREVVEFIKNDPLSLGALVTTHKIDLLEACRNQFDELDEYAELMGEVSCISKKNGKLIGHAKDPITSGLSIEAFIPDGYWKKSRADVFIIGAGGASIAISWYLLNKIKTGNYPSKIFISNRSMPRLEEMKQIHSKITTAKNIEYIFASEREDNDKVIRKLKPGSLIINATGLGKDSPGSPLSGEELFPNDAYIWDLNYRGDLLFLEQALKQKKTRNLIIEDGWIYFIHGWTSVIAEVFNTNIPTSGETFNKLSEIASSLR